MICNIGIITLVSNTKEELIINFIDVGQGDSTLIRYKSKIMIIDTGGSMDSSYDVGKSVLHRYLLNQGVKIIDYMMISHFDADHCQGAIYILENMEVKNLIIGKQFEICDNYKKISKIAKENGVNIYTVQAGDRIKIKDNLYFDILWPDSENVINDNILNNNSLVCKLIYINFNVLFTGDIEEKAEKAILKKYEDNLNILKSTILKAGHHGSKTSTTQEFLNNVSPKIALIGVGENNKFGHPSNITIENMNKLNIQIFRTDKMGEISLKINKKGRIKIKKKIN